MCKRDHSEQPSSPGRSKLPSATGQQQQQSQDSKSSLLGTTAPQAQSSAAPLDSAVVSQPSISLPEGQSEAGASAKRRRHDQQQHSQEDVNTETGCTVADVPPAASVLLMPRSLLVFQDTAYEECLHGIEQVSIVQPGRLTCLLP